jgi:hypothetical protein
MLCLLSHILLFGGAKIWVMPRNLQHIFNIKEIDFGQIRMACENYLTIYRWVWSILNRSKKNPTSTLSQEIA